VFAVLDKAFGSGLQPVVDMNSPHLTGPTLTACQ